MMNDLNSYRHKALVLIQHLGLLVIAIATVIAMGVEITGMFQVMTITLADLLLLFIYLEVLEMVAIYLETGKLPVRIPLYISIVALARYLILDMKNLETWRIIAIAVAVLIIALTTLVIRFGHCRFPYDQKDSK